MTKWFEEVANDASNIVSSRVRHERTLLRDDPRIRGAAFGDVAVAVDEPGFALKQMSDLEPKFFAPTVRSRST